METTATGAATTEKRRSLPLRKFEVKEFILELLKSRPEGLVTNLYSPFVTIIKNYKLNPEDVKIVAFMKSYLEVRRHLDGIVKGEEKEDRTSEKGVSLETVKQAYTELCEDIDLNVLAHLIKIEKLTGIPVRNSDNHFILGNKILVWDDTMFEDAQKIANKMK